MSNSDLDWLYGRDKPGSSAGNPEPTKVIQPGVIPGGTGPGPRPPAYRPAPGPPAGAYPSPGGSYQPPGPPGPPLRPVRTKRRRPVRRLFLTLFFLFLVSLVWFLGVPFLAFNGAPKIDAVPPGQRPSDQPGTTYLLVGSDARENLTPEQRKQLGRTPGKRADTIMLLHVPPSGRPALISLPRDSFLEIPGRQKNKINAAYSLGGAGLLTATVERATNLRIDHYVEIGFDGFSAMVDAVGGVRICPKQDFNDRLARLNIKAGCQQADGKVALGYVRARYSDRLGDLGRVNRQREVLAAIFKAAATPWTILNPVRYWQLNHAVAQAITTDRDTGVLGLIPLASGMREISNGSGVTMTVPIKNPDAQTSAGSAVLWDNEKATRLFTALARGDTSGL